MDSPSPRFSDTSARFTEHLSSSPPYNQYSSFNPDTTPAPQYGSGGDNAGQFQRSLSSKERHSSPDMIESGLEPVIFDHNDKEVAYPSMQSPPYNPYAGPGAASQQKPKKRVCGVGATLFWILVAAVTLVVLAVALGVGLGVGLSRSGSSNSNDTGLSANQTQYMIGGAINPEYYTTTGAFNGTGIALASQSFASNLSDSTQGSVVMYFQHHSGQIRWMQLSTEGNWLGGGPSEVVAIDARNSTPLSAVAYSLNETSTWHIFYIDTNNTIKQRSNSNTTNVWVDGPVNDLDLKAFDGEQVGMQACWYGSDYGDSDYKHTPLPGQSADQGSPDEAGMHLWYASDNSTFQQYGWRAQGQDNEWQFQQEWPNKNGHAGVGCYSWGPTGTTTYVMFVNLQNTAEIWWKDTNTNLTNTTTHPINTWTNSSVGINNVNPSSSLGYTNYFYAQDAATNMFKGYNITWAGENTTRDDGFFVTGDPALPGSHLSVTAIPGNSGGDYIAVFYQNNGSDVTEYNRDLVAGQWLTVNIPIPQS